jgi:hypothetical protein
LSLHFYLPFVYFVDWSQSKPTFIFASTAGFCFQLDFNVLNDDNLWSTCKCKPLDWYCTLHTNIDLIDSIYGVQSTEKRDYITSAIFEY